MKAIKVTTLNKSKNSEFFQGNAVGSIVAKSLPSTYYGVEVVNGYYFVRTDLHLQDGFKDIVQPTYNSTTQKVTSEIIDNPNDSNTYTYSVVNLTQQEIDANAQNALDSDTAATKVSDRRNDGEEYYKRKMDAIERAFHNNLLSVEPIKFANRYFDVALSPLTRGNWASTQTALLTTPTIPQSFTNAEKQLLSQFYQGVKMDVDNYVNQTYQ